MAARTATEPVSLLALAARAVRSEFPGRELCAEELCAEELSAEELSAEELCAEELCAKQLCTEWEALQHIEEQPAVDDAARRRILQRAARKKPAPEKEACSSCRGGAPLENRGIARSGLVLDELDTDRLANPAILGNAAIRHDVRSARALTLVTAASSAATSSSQIARAGEHGSRRCRSAQRRSVERGLRQPSRCE